VQPPTADLFVAGGSGSTEQQQVAAIPLKSPPAATPAIKRRGGFVNSWRS
jgi:hypothetical protein